MHIPEQRIESTEIDGIHVPVGRMPRVGRSRPDRNGIRARAGDAIGGGTEIAGAVAPCRVPSCRMGAIWRMGSKIGLLQ